MKPPSWLPALPSSCCRAAIGESRRYSSSTAATATSGEQQQDFQAEVDRQLSL
jgi:hypothetical protein